MDVSAIMYTLRILYNYGWVFTNSYNRRILLFLFKMILLLIRYKLERRDEITKVIPPSIEIHSIKDEVVNLPTPSSPVIEWEIVENQS